MPKFSINSRNRLNTCDYRLQAIFNFVIEHFDCTVIEGERGKEVQNRLFNQGLSKAKYPLSKHNKKPSEAVDVAPYPTDWKDKERFNQFAFFVLGVAAAMGIPIRWGGDWDGDTETADNNFNDLAHFELKL